MFGAYIWCDFFACFSYVFDMKGTNILNCWDCFKFRVVFQFGNTEINLGISSRNGQKNNFKQSKVCSKNMDGTKSDMFLLIRVNL